MEKIPEISVIILCYKAGSSVTEFINKMVRVVEERDLTYELVLVANYNQDEHKTDTTPSIVKELAANNPNLVVVSKPKEGMFGWDVRSGFGQARGSKVAFIDGDGQMPAEDVVRVYDELERTGSDMVQTFRVKRLDSLERIMISRIYNFLLKVLFPKVIVWDTNSKPKIFTREAFERLNLVSDDWFIDAEIIIQATEKRFKISQIPTVFLKNNSRPSFVKFSTIFEFIGNLIRYRLFRKSE